MFSFDSYMNSSPSLQNGLVSEQSSVLYFSTNWKLDRSKQHAVLRLKSEEVSYKTLKEKSAETLVQKSAGKSNKLNVSSKGTFLREQENLKPWEGLLSRMNLHTLQPLTYYLKKKKKSKKLSPWEVGTQLGTGLLLSSEN